MVDFSAWHQAMSMRPYDVILFIVFLAALGLILALMLVPGDKEDRKAATISAGVVFLVSFMLLFTNSAVRQSGHPSFNEALASSYGFDSVRCGWRGVLDDDTECVAYLDHGRKRERVTMVEDTGKQTVKVYDTNGDLIEPVLKKAPTEKGK